MPTLLVPEAGVAVGVVKANVPGTDAVPPVSGTSDRGVPKAIFPAVGGVVMVGVAREIVMGTVVVMLVKLAVSVGVKVTPTLRVPEAGVAVGVVKAKVPGTDAVPPVRVAPDKDDP